MTALGPVALHELGQLADGRHWSVDQPIAGFDSLLPVRGHLSAFHHGNMVEVKGFVSTIVTLCCDRCLQHYNQDLTVHARELLEVCDADASNGASAMVNADQLPGDRLDPRGSFDPEQWLFEQLSLRLPIVNRCGGDCPGPHSWSSSEEERDPRWGALRALLES